MKKYTLLIVGISIGAIISLFGFYVLYYVSESVLTILLLSIVTLSVVATLLYLNRNKIIQEIKLKTTIPFENIESETVNLLEGTLLRDQKQISQSIKLLLPAIYNKYLELKLSTLILRTSVALLIAFGALFGSYILFKQNQLIEKQNIFFQEQNKQITSQFEKQMTFQQDSRKAELHTYLYDSNEDTKNEELENLLEREKLKINKKIATNYPLTRNNAIESLININQPTVENPMNLTESLLHDLNLISVRFNNIDISGANLTNSQLAYYNLPKGLMYGMNFHKSVFVDSSNYYHLIREKIEFSNCLFFETQFFPCYLRKPYFERSIFSIIHWGGKNAAFRRIFIEEGEFIESLFYKVAFGKITMTNSFFAECEFDQTYINKFSKLKNLTFVDCSFKDKGIEIGEQVELDSIRFFNMTKDKSIKPIKELLFLKGNSNDFFDRHEIIEEVFEGHPSILILNKKRLNLPIQFNETR